MGLFGIRLKQLWARQQSLDLRPLQETHEEFLSRSGSDKLLQDADVALRNREAKQVDVQ